MYIKTADKLYEAHRIYHNIPTIGDVSFFDGNEDNDTFNQDVVVRIDDIEYISDNVLVD